MTTASCNSNPPVIHTVGASRSDCGTSDACTYRLGWRNDDGTWDCQEWHNGDCDCPSCAAADSVYCSANACAYHIPSVYVPPPTNTAAIAKSIRQKVKLKSLITRDYIIRRNVPGGNYKKKTPPTHLRERRGPVLGKLSACYGFLLLRRATSQMRRILFYNCFHFLPIHSNRTDSFQHPTDPSEIKARAPGPD
jgi:hypothetical protein